MSDTSLFPHPVYKDTVLAPLFEGVKNHFAHSMAQINRAHLVMLHETDILQVEQASAIASALQTIEAKVDIESLEYTGQFEDYFFLVEHQLREQLGPDLGGMLHTARSRNDMDHTVFKLQLRERVDASLQLGCKLAAALLNKAREQRDTPIVAYTHGQPAQPSTFGHYLCAILEVFLSDLRRLAESRKLLDYCPMGAAAITTTGFPINRHRVAELLGFTEPKRNSYGCIASVDYITAVYSAIKLIHIHLGRVVQDMAFWSSFEVGQLKVPNSLVQISSIMPQKRNPVPIEHLRHLASVTAGRCDVIINTMHNTPFTDMNDSEGEVQSAGFSAFDSGARVLRLFTALIESVSINEEKVQQNSDAACATITELADTLVRVESLSFRQAHEISALTAKAVLADNLPLNSGFSHFSHAFRNLTDRSPSMNKAQFEECVSIRHFIQSRNRYGGPAADAMDDSIDCYAIELQALNTDVAESRDRSVKAQSALQHSFQQLLER